MASTRPDTKTSHLQENALQIVYLPIADLKLNPKNPRRHSKKQIRQIARSIQTFGFNVPLITNAQNEVIAGHGRALACPLAGITTVPTIRLDHLTEAQLTAFMIADNKLTENGVWDEHLLAEQLKSLAEVELDFSLEVTGFEMGEIDVRIEGLAPALVGSKDSGDELPDSTNAVPASHLGGLWLLGRHRVLCGNAVDEKSYEVLMEGRLAAAAFTDPPYNIPIDGYVTGFGKIHHPEFAMACGEMSDLEFTEFLNKVLSHIARHSSDGALEFICMDWRHTPEILEAARSVFTEFKNLCVWVKDNAGQGSLYRSQHELVFVFKNGKGTHRNNVQLGQFGRYRTNVWQYSRVNGFSRTSDEGHLSALHPTIKPVQLVADAILDCTARGDTVLDAFLGSGTTVIAAERTGRICYGLEINPTYVDTIIRRWQTFTGQSAIDAASGKTFVELEEEGAHGL